MDSKRIRFNLKRDKHKVGVFLKNNNVICVSDHAELLRILKMYICTRAFKYLIGY